MKPPNSKHWKRLAQTSLKVISMSLYLTSISGPDVLLILASSAILCKLRGLRIEQQTSTKRNKVYETSYRGYAR